MTAFVEDTAEKLGNMPVLQAQDFDPPEGVDSKAKQWLCIFGFSGFTDGCSGKVARIAAEFACSLCVRDVSKPREKFVYLKPGVTWPLESIAAGRPFSSTVDGERCSGTFWRQLGRGLPWSTWTHLCTRITSSQMTAGCIMLPVTGMACGCAMVMTQNRWEQAGSTWAKKKLKCGWGLGLRTLPH